MPSRLRVRFSPTADNDFSEILHYTLAEWGEAQAYDYMSALTNLIDSLARFEKMGRTRSEWASGLRSFPVREHVIYYIADTSWLVVVRILHKRRDPGPSDFSKLE